MAASVSGTFHGLPAAPLLRRAWSYAQLMRLDRPIGIFLLLWPTLWALWIAARMLPGAERAGTLAPLPSLKLLLVFIAGTVVMRSAGCVINDFADRNIDPHVKRTRGRPLAARRVSPQEALALFGVLVLLALWLVMQLDNLTVLLLVRGRRAHDQLSVHEALLRAAAVLAGRGLRLGRAHGLRRHRWALVPRTGWLVFIATLLWSGVYDTLYAMVDRDDDLKLGVQSTAIAFGDMDTLLVGVMQVMVLGALVLAGRLVGMQWPFYLSLVVAALLFAWQQWMVRDRDREACFRAFLNNHWVGLVIMAGVALG